MKEEVLSLVQSIVAILLLIGMMVGVNFLILKFVPNIVSRNYEERIQELEAKIIESDDINVKLYYLYQKIGIEEEFKTKQESNFAEERAMLIIFPLMLFFVSMVLATEKLMDTIFEIVDELKERKTVQIES